LSWSLNIQAGPLRKHLLLWFSRPIRNTVREERIQATYQWQIESSIVKGGVVMTWWWMQVLAGYDGRFIVQSGETSVLGQVSQNAYLAFLTFKITLLMHNRSRFESHKI
jgi:hypothetical protein